jgi:O-antigen ligase
MVNSSGLKTFHLNLWQEFSKKSFIIQLIVVLFLVTYCRKLIFTCRPIVIFTILSAIISFPFLLQRPLYGIFAIIILTASFIDVQILPIIPFIVGSILSTDLLFAVLFLYIIGRKLYYKNFYHLDYPLVRTPIDIPIVFLCFAFLIGFINGYFVGGEQFDFELARRTFRSVIYYLLFFLITNLVTNKKDLILLIKGTFLIALITSCVSIAQQGLGTSLPLIFGRVETLKTMGFGGYAGVTRAIPPGLLFIYFSLITLICIASSEGYEGSKPLLALQIIILGLGLIFSYYRNMWVTFFLSILLFFSITTVRQKLRMVLWVFLGVWAFIIIFLYTLNAPDNKVTRIVNATQDRMLSVFKVKAVKGAGSDTLRSRSVENEFAFKKIMKYPILGIGLGTRYKPVKRLLLGASPSDPQSIVTSYFLGGIMLHNSFLNIPLRFGLVGFIAFLWISAVFLVRGFRNWRKIKDPFFRAVCIGYTVSYVGTLITSNVDPFLTEWRGVIGIAIMWGTNEAIYRLEGIENKK